MHFNHKGELVDSRFPHKRYTVSGSKVFAEVWMTVPLIKFCTFLLQVHRFPCMWRQTGATSFHVQENQIEILILRLHFNEWLSASLHSVNQNTIFTPAACMRMKWGPFSSQVREDAMCACQSRPWMGSVLIRTLNCVWDVEIIDTNSQQPDICVSRRSVCNVEKHCYCFECNA